MTSLVTTNTGIAETNPSLFANVVKAADLAEFKVNKVFSTFEPGELLYINDDLTVTGSASVSTNAFIGAGGTGFAVLGSDSRIGIGTSDQSSSIQVLTSATATLNMHSETASSVISLSSDITGHTTDTSHSTSNRTHLTIGI